MNAVFVDLKTFSGHSIPIEAISHISAISGDQAACPKIHLINGETWTAYLTIEFKP